MGFLDDIVAQQSGGGMMGGLPASWQYQNPESLTPEQRQMMALVGSQNADKAGFNPLDGAPGAFPAGNAAPLAGANSPFGMLPSPVQTPASFPQGGDPMAGTGSGNNGGLPAAPAAMPSPPISTDNSAPPSPFPQGGDPMTSGMASAPTFGAGALPIFAAPAGLPGTPAMPSLAKAADDGEEDPAPTKPNPNAPATPIAVGGVQMPRIGSQAAFTPDPAALPANSQPTQGQGSPGGQGGGIVSGYQKLMNRGADALSSVAKGGSLLGAIRGQYDDPAAKAGQIGNLTARALISRGVAPEMAIAAVQPGNGELLKELMTHTFTQGKHTQETDKDGNIWDVNAETGQRTLSLAAKDDKFQHVETKDALGNQTSRTFNTKTGEYKDAPGGDGPAGAPGFGALLAKGVTYDPNKSGDEYMAQFGPEVQAAAKAYIKGDVMPSGNARMNAIATFAKSIAQKWGQDKGIPVNDSTYAGKRNMAIQLTGSSNSSMGGILSNGESSFSHLAELTGSMAGLGNASHNFWGGGIAAHGQNYLTNGMGGSDVKAKIGATIDNLGKYGAESTKFYAGTGGGVEERTAARKDVDPNVVSGEEMAAFAEKEKSLMLDRLNTKFQEIRNTYGEEEGNAIIAKHMPQIQKNIATIDANVAKMRGTPATPAESSASIPTLKVGQSANYNGVSIKKVAD